MAILGIAAAWMLLYCSSIMNPRSLKQQASAWLAALLSCALAAHGQGPAAPVPAAVPAASAFVRTGMAQPSVNYRLRARDTVHIRVFQEDDMEVSDRLDKDGNIAFPLLGKARIGGQTVQEATATMEALLKEYLINPQVSLEIVSYSKQHFTMLGQINRPGTFDIPDESSVNILEAIGMAGGYTKIANADKIFVRRVVDGKEVVIRIYGSKLLKQKYASEPIFQVLPGDTISVGEAIF